MCLHRCYEGLDGTGRAHLGPVARMECDVPERRARILLHDGASRVCAHCCGDDLDGTGRCHRELVVAAEVREVGQRGARLRLQEDAGRVCPHRCHERLYATGLCNLDPHGVVAACEVVERQTRRLLHGLHARPREHGVDDAGRIGLRRKDLQLRGQGVVAFLILVGRRGRRRCVLRLVERGVGLLQPVDLPLHLLLLALPGCLFLLALLADRLHQGHCIGCCERLHLLDVRGGRAVLEQPADVWQRPKELDARRDREPALRTRVHRARRTGRPVAVGVPAAEAHTSCAERFHAEGAFKGERNVVQVPAQLCSLRPFRVHHRLQLRMPLHMLALFLLHDFLLHLHSRVQVPHQRSSAEGDFGRSSAEGGQTGPA